MSILLDGLSLGAVYALIALGYTMVYGIAKMLNFAHGDIIMVGAYAIYLTISINTNPIIAIIVSTLVSIVVCTVTGVLTEKLAYKPLRGASPLAVLITAIGVSNLLQGIAQLIFSTNSRSFTVYDFGKVSIFGSEISMGTIITLIVGVIIMVALQLFVKKTKTGRAMLAVSEDSGAARLMGVNVDKIIMITFAIGSALAAFASLFYIIRIPSVTPQLGAMPGIKAFTAAVIGGIGSIPGAMLGGILMGVIEQICQNSPLQEYTTAIEFALLIVILLVRPVGLLGKRRREKV